MRIDLVPILAQANALVEAIRAKSASKASSAAHNLLCRLPDPTWAETAPGMRIYYGAEQDIDNRLNMLRYSAMKWLGWLITPDTDCEPNHQWPEPNTLSQSILALSEYAPGPTEAEPGAIN